MTTYATLELRITHAYSTSRPQTYPCSATDWTSLGIFFFFFFLNWKEKPGGNKDYINLVSQTSKAVTHCTVIWPILYAEKEYSNVMYVCAVVVDKIKNQLKRTPVRAFHDGLSCLMFFLWDRSGPDPCYLVKHPLTHASVILQRLVEPTTRSGLGLLLQVMNETIYALKT